MSKEKKKLKDIENKKAIRTTTKKNEFIDSMKMEAPAATYNQ